ncbi:ABC transporter ATP-binding protein [Rhizobiaceae bacterium CRRU44]|uniref:ABC transporter ATP-binding protein n=1 Tax=Ferranicluibacter rubi TaxID=2715133 RepID=A0AA44CCY5_9HYPH|nr:ABC transporter ATP-binding protein [Ferranicluibacter rubi]NHT78633.1 ABC transporter ATP-binding protein [Ferranicluibacter rubi]
MSSAPPSLVRSILVDFWRASRGMLLLVSVLTMVTAVVAVAGPYVFSRMIDRMQPGALAETVALGLVAYAVLVGLSSALQRAQNYLAHVCGEHLALIVSTSLFERLLHKTAPFFVEHNPVEIETAGQRGDQALVTMLHLTLGYLVSGSVQIALSLALIGATVSLEIVAVSVLYGAAFIALSVAADRRSTRYLEAAIAAGQENARFVGNALTGMETLRHFGAHGWMRSLFSQKAEAVFRNWRDYSLSRIGFAGLQGAALALQLGVTFLMLVPRMQAGLISVGDVVLFNTLLLALNQPFEAIGATINELAKTRGNLAPLQAIWAAPEEETTAAAEALRLSEGTLRFEAVGYRYENGRGVENVSFTAARGGITTLTGETGAGKSTVFRLALKSLEPQSGEITIDGRPLAGIARATWYGRIGVVPQDILLLSDTLSVNITLGRPVDAQKLRRVAHQAAILSTIEALPEGFETSVGERGLKLSGGERQRIAIARALYGDPDILFLDEASSALDAATEREILNGLRQLADRVTVIAITHRTGMIEPGDTVVRIGPEAGGP